MADDLRELAARLTREPLIPKPTGESPRLAQLGGVRAVLFDVYGTLLVSGTGDVGTVSETSPEFALTAAFADAGIALASEDAAAKGVELYRQGILDWHDRAHSRGVEFPEVEIRDIWRGVLDELLAADAASGTVSPEIIERLACSYEFRSNAVWGMPGAGEVLDRLRSSPLLLGIVSNAQFYTPLVLRQALGSDVEQLGFDPALCAWSWELGEAKPSARLFETVLAPLTERGVSPVETLYVGNDMLKDVWCASRAGCRTALFAGDARSLRKREDDERCAGLESDLVLTDLRQLFECLPPAG